MEPANEVEIYRGEIVPTDQNPSLTPGLSYISIGLYDITREIFRPTQGPDLWLHHSKYLRETYVAPVDISAADNLYHSILCQEPPLSCLGGPTYMVGKALNPEWSWEEVARDLCQYAAEKRIFEMPPPAPIVINADIGFGTLTMMDQARTWVHAEGGSPIAADGEKCAICTDLLGPTRCVALPCRHVYHKLCLGPALWTTPDFKCCICRKIAFY